MKKLSESLWTDIQRRSAGDTVREEDKFNPEYFDFGKDTTVYWASESLEINGREDFHFNEIKNYNENGWRLPTIEEVGQIDWHKAKNNIIFYSGVWKINVLGNVFKLKTNFRRLFMWTCEEDKSNRHNAIAYGFHDAYDFYVDSFDKNNGFCVFLVKDK
jgi:hypothetical protein